MFPDQIFRMRPAALSKKKKKGPDTFTGKTGA